MQKVVGSSPIIRFDASPRSGGFFMVRSRGGDAVVNGKEISIVGPRPAGALVRVGDELEEPNHDDSSDRDSDYEHNE